MKNNYFALKLDTELELDQDLIDLISSYINNIKKDYIEMGRALENSNFQTIVNIAHKVKGSAKSYGFDYIDDLMLAIQNDIKNGGKDLREYYSYFGRFLDKVESKLKEV